MVKIYIQNKPLYLTDGITAEINGYLHRPETIFIEELNAATVKTMLHELEQSRFYTGIFLHKNTDELLHAFKQHLTLVMAAGGLVHTKDNELLLIFRKGKWDLPKGKLDDGENIQSCALREIKEETGADHLLLEQHLTTTYHTYYERSKHILKESLWFLVSAKEKVDLQPQTEEDIEQCKWVPLDEVQGYLDHTYASIVDVINEGVKVLGKQA